MSAGRLPDTGRCGQAERRGAVQYIVERFNALFNASHPAVRFAVDGKGTTSAVPLLMHGKTLFGAMGMEDEQVRQLAIVGADGRITTGTAAEVSDGSYPYGRWLCFYIRSLPKQPVDPLVRECQVYGYDATPIRIGYNGHGPRSPHKTPPAVYVQAGNPLKGLNMVQLAQIFTAGAPRGDINLWSQLGLGGDYAQRRIHAYGLRDDGGFAAGMRIARLNGRPFAIKYEALPTREAVIRAVAADPFGIALLGWVDAVKTSNQVRVLPLAADSGNAYHTPSYDEVRRGEYPLSASVQFYVNRAPGQPLDPLVREYLRLALSAEGQDILVRQRDTAEGYAPLSQQDLQTELSKLQGM